MVHKERFAKSILYSAIITSLYAVSGNSVAQSCPGADEGGNIHVSSGVFCTGGIRPDEPVNNIGVEGVVDGDIVNNSGINDFWMNEGTLTGSYINNDEMNDVAILNGSEIFNDIRNYGQMNNIRIEDSPGKDTVVYGSVINSGDIRNIYLSGEHARVDRNIQTTVDGEVTDILIVDGATVGGSVLSEGDLGHAVVVGNASVEGNVENSSEGFFGIGVFDEANIGGDVINSGDGFIMTNANGSRIEGSMINRGSIAIMEVYDGATVVTDLLNEGDVYEVVLRDRGRVEGNLHNSGSIADGVQVFDAVIGNDLVNSGVVEDGIGVVRGSSIGGNLINDADGISQGSIELLDQVAVGGNVENRGEISFESDRLPKYAEYLPWRLVDIEPAPPEGDAPVPPLIYDVDLGGIRVDHQTAITGQIINSGNINIHVPEMAPPPEPPEPAPMIVFEGGYLPEIDREGDGYSLGFNSLSGISISNQSSTGGILNTGNISVHAGLDEPFYLFGDGISVNGISVRQGSVVEGITNEGTISADTFGIHIDGEGIEGSTRIDGSIVNAEGATIESGYNGIFVNSAEVTGSVVNSGEITSFTDDHFSFANGIHINDALVHRDVINDGIINSGVEGISINGSRVKGNLINEGELNVRSDGLYITNASVIEGDIVSSGTIRAIEHDGIDIADSTVEGSIRLSGHIEAGDNAIEIDGGFLNNGDVDEEPAPFVYTVIGEDINNSASLSNVIPDGEVHEEVDGGDGFNMDYVEIGGRLINSGDIRVTERGFSLEDVTIGSHFINSGDITAGQQGIFIRVGDNDDDIEPESIRPTEIGGHFVNTGNIEAVDTGVVLEQVSILGNVEDEEQDFPAGSFVNTGAIESDKSSAIDIKASNIAGDFINTGNLTVNAVLFHEEGEFYSEQWDGATAEDGKVRLTSMGIDSNGDAWFRIRNENTESHVVYMDDNGGDFFSGLISVAPGEVVYINTGEHSGGPETHRLFDADDDSQLQVKASGQHEFSPRPVEAVQRGISLTGNLYDDDGMIEVERSLNVEGSVINSGDIDANDEGIYIENAVIGGEVENTGNVVNSGVINTDDVGIEIVRSEVSGSIVNLEDGEINAGLDGIRISDVSGVENIVNRGAIVAGMADGMSGDGLLISDVEMSGIVANTGSITADGRGIVLSDVEGATGFENSGVINAGGVGVEISQSEVNGSIINFAEGEINAGYGGIRITGVSGVESIGNHGTIVAGNAEGMSGDGVLVMDVDMNGLVSNTGSVTADTLGVALFGVDGATGFENSGTINAHYVGMLGVASEINGNVINGAEGVINAVEDGMILAGVDGVTNVANHGAINVEDGSGIALYDSLFARGDDGQTVAQVINSGSISSGYDGVVLDEVDGVADLANTGSINAEMGSGISLYDTSVSGQIVNSGSIRAGDDGIVARDSFVTTIINSGSIIAGTAYEDGYTQGNGIAVYDLSLDGEETLSIQNSADGAITAVNDGIRLGAVDGNTVVVNAGTINAGDDGIDAQYVEGSVRLDNTGTIIAQEDGIDIEDGVGSITLDNRGLITARSDVVEIIESVGDINILNEGELRAENDDGSADVLDFSGNDGNITIVNTGSMVASGAEGGSDVVDIDNTDGNIVIDNRGIVESVSSEGGSDSDAFDISNVSGNLTIVNSSSINANTVGDDNDALDLGSIYGALEITNTGTISANGAGQGNNAINIGSLYANDAENEDLYPALRIANSGSISSSGNAIELDSARDGAAVIENAGSIVSGDDAMQLFNVGHGLTVTNSGSVTAGSDVLYADSVSGGIEFVNTGELTATSEVTKTDVVDIRFADGNISISNSGEMVSSGIGGGASAISVWVVQQGDVDITNTGLIEVETTENTNDSDAVDVSDVNGNVTISNSGDINANFIGGNYNDGLGIKGVTGEVVITNSGTVSALGSETNSGLDIEDVQGNITINNAGTISSGGVAVELDTPENDGVMQINNTGTLSSVSAAAISLEGRAEGQIENYGVIDGGIYQQPEEEIIPEEGERGLDYSSAVAIDYRFADSALDFLNGQNDSGSGSVDGDIYGSDQDSDQIEFAAGQYSDNIYDVENVNVTGLVSLTGDIFSLGNSSRLSVTDTGTLSMGSGDQVNLEGAYYQEGDMVLVLNQNTGSLSEPVLDVTGEAELGADSALRVSVENRDISNINSGADSQEVHLIHAGEGVTDNGLDVQSDSILFSYEKFERASGVEGDEEFGLIASINNLGDLAAAAGADTNVVNALNGFQGEAFSGLEALQESNPDLYNDIYDGTEESLAALGSSLLASPDSGIAASQSAQSEALNTILARIADLRSGASGVSAGDEDVSSPYRPDALWMRAIYSDGKQDAVSASGSDFNAYTLRSTGFTIGMDKDVTDNLTLGAGFSHATSTVNEQASAQSAANTETSSYIGSFYSSWRNLSYFVDGTFNYGISKNELKRASGDTKFDASQFGISFLAGRGFLFNDNDTLLEPQVGFNYTRLNSDGYSYTSNNEQVNVGGQKLEAIELGAGLRFTKSFELGNGVLLPEASLMMWHDFAADSVSTELEFETGGGSFVYFGPEGVKNRYQAGLGMEYLMDNNVTLTARYDRNWQKGFGADTWTAKVRYDF